jgi:hypothetical protein
MRSEVIKNEYWQSSTSVKTQPQPQPNTFQPVSSIQYNLNDSNKYPAQQNQQLDRSSPPVQAQLIKNPQPVPTQDNYANKSPQVYAGSKQDKNAIFYSPKNENTNFNLGAFSNPKA